MNQRPPNEDDDVDERYRRASARDASRPSESVRRAILHHAAELGARQAGRSAPVQGGLVQNTLGADRTVDAGPVKLDFKQPAANEARWRPAAYGGLAAAALAGLLIAPHFLPSTSPPGSSSPRAIVSASKKTEAAPTAQIEAPQAPAAEASSAAPAPSRSTQEVPAPVPRAAQGVPAAAMPAHTVPLNTSLAPLDKAAPALAAKPRAFAHEAPLGESAPANLAGRQAPRAALLAAPAAPPPQAAAAPPAQVVGSSALSALAAGARAPIDSATALRQAALSGDTLRLKALLERQIDVDARDSAGRTALMLAVIAGQAQAVDELLARGADANAADSSGTTPLAAALAAKHADIIAALRRAGAH